MSTETAVIVGGALLVGAFVAGLLVGPKWWNWRTFVALVLVLFIPLMMSFFIPLPMVILLNIAVSHAVWARKHRGPSGGSESSDGAGSDGEAGHPPVRAA